MVFKSDRQRKMVMSRLKLNNSFRTIKINRDTTRDEILRFKGENPKSHENKVRYAVYVGGNPVFFDTRKERDTFFNKKKKTGQFLSNGQQDRDNFKSYIWKRKFVGDDIIE